MRLKTSLIESKKGFTLVEILVVVTIIIIILALTLASYRTGNQRLTLKRAVHKLAQDIRKTQEMAMSTRESGGSIPRGGYGLVFATSTIGGFDFLHGYIVSSFQQDNQTSSAVEQIKLESGIKINSLYSVTGGTETAVTSVYFNFIPPQPATCVLACTADGVKIILSLEQDPTVTRSVKVNKAGLIEIVE